MIGTILRGRYEIISPLGSGSFGVVYLAKDMDRPGQPQCIVKQLKPLANDPYTLQVAERLFTEEARVLESVGNHEQIPILLAHFTENNEFYLVQEYIVGKTLRQEIIDRKQNNQSWSENELSNLLKSILEPLNYVHNTNVIHRDLKPDNLIIRATDNKIVMIDFGAVKQRLTTQFSYTQSNISPTLKPTIAIGTKGYMPTEQLRGFPTTASDVYAVGMIIIEIITGMLPESLIFDENGEVIWQNQAKVKIGQKLANILTKMVKDKQNQRYKNAGEVLKEFQLKPSLNLKYLVSSLALLLGIIGISGLIIFNKNKVKFITYQDENYNLTIDYPENWSIENNPNAFNLNFVKFISPLNNKDDSFQEMVTLSTENLANNPLSLNEYTNEIFTDIKNNMDPNVETPVNITFANKQGKKIIFVTKEDDITVKRMQVWTIENYNAYILTFTADQNQFNKMSQSVDIMIQSFQIDQ